MFYHKDNTDNYYNLIWCSNVISNYIVNHNRMWVAISSKLKYRIAQKFDEEKL